MILSILDSNITCINNVITDPSSSLVRARSASSITEVIHISPNPVMIGFESGEGQSKPKLIQARKFLKEPPIYGLGRWSATDQRDWKHLALVASEANLISNDESY